MIVPALLTNNKDDLQKMLDLCSQFAGLVQIDIMDGQFVSSSSVTRADLEQIRPVKNPSEAHLMVNDPIAWLDVFKRLGTERVLFHAEIKQDPLTVIKAIKKKSMRAGIAVNPATELKEFEALVDKDDAVLFMSVVPGFYGARFIPEVLEKIKQFRRKYPGIIVGIDGGIKADNVVEVKRSGIDYICVGSAIFKDADPGAAYAKLVSWEQSVVIKSGVN
jgi:ribulose-phosphate 3-epimerase